MAAAPAKPSVSVPTTCEHLYNVELVGECVAGEVGMEGGRPVKVGDVAEEDIDDDDVYSRAVHVVESHGIQCRAVRAVEPHGLRRFEDGSSRRSRSVGRGSRGDGRGSAWGRGLRGACRGGEAGGTGNTGNPTTKQPIQARWKHRLKKERHVAPSITLYTGFVNSTSIRLYHLKSIP